MCQKYENMRFDKVIAKIIRVQFFASQCIVTKTNHGQNHPGQEPPEQPPPNPNLNSRVSVRQAYCPHTTNRLYLKNSNEFALLTMRKASKIYISGKLIDDTLAVETAASDLSFLPRDAIHTSAAYAVMRCLSVCLSVTFVQS